MAPLPAHEVFVGRAAELEQLCWQLSAVRLGRSRLVVVEGEAGIGKSALIRRFLSEASDLRVVTASGDEAEASLPYGMITQVIASAGTACLEAFPLLRGGPPSTADPLAVGGGLLGLLGEMQDSGPVALVIEDLQWIDNPSAQALLFAFRRLIADRVLVLISARPPVLRDMGEAWNRLLTTDPRSLRMRLGGLSAAEVAEMSEAMGTGLLSSRGAHRLVEHTGGNALFSRALLEELPPGALDGHPEDPLPAPESLAAIILPRLLALSDDARRLVSAAAILGVRTTLEAAGAVAGIADPTDALEEALAARVLVEAGAFEDAISFTHHLVRQAVLDNLGLAQRRDLHLAASDVVEPGAALAHRVAAARGPDPALARDLRTAADAAHQRRAHSRAAEHYLQAARASEPGSTREHLLLSCIESYLRVGEVASAETVRPLVEALGPSARRDAALGHLALVSARSAEAEALLLSAWATHEVCGQARAGADAALLLGTLYVLSRSGQALTWTERALATPSPDEQWAAIACYTGGIARALVESPQAALATFAPLPDAPSLVPASQTDALTGRGMVKLWCDDLAGAAEDLSVAATRVREGSQVHYPGQPLAFLAEAEIALGRWDDAALHAELAVSLAHDADRRWDYPFTHAIAAKVPALRGDWDQALAHVRTAEEAAARFGARTALIFAAEARCTLGFARDDPAEVLRGAAVALGSGGGPCSGSGTGDRGPVLLGRGWRPLHIWALIRLERLDEALSALDEFSTAAVSQQIPSRALRTGRLVGMLADARGDFEAANQAFADARQAASKVLLPFHRALIDLDWGRSLRKSGKHKAALDSLSLARATLDGLGARPFVAACDAELRAMGRPAPISSNPLARLTPQEAAVAHLVARGLSNREAAAELYVSPKTIEFHLGNAYAKLGVRGRGQLAGALRGDPGA
jgi:ATP/maltotriose-dependent transcriptional regulator MalT